RHRNSRSDPAVRPPSNFAKAFDPAAQTVAGATLVRSQDTEVSFALKPAKAAQNFEPSVGAKVPGGVKLHPLPRPLMNEMQPLRRYGYIKFKNQVLIVNPMTRTIVDMFPET